MDVVPVAVWTRPVPKGGAEALMEETLSRARASGSEVLIVDGDMVFGSDHVRSAATHAAKAVAEGRNSSDSLAMETLLYASGERQLSAAIRKMSVGERTEKVVVAVLAGPFSPGEGWTELPDRPGAPDRAALTRFGISEREMTTVREDRLGELVLERVAAVDVLKR